jgi:hypothetical protein
MTVEIPPRPPHPDEVEALIEEARRRARRRRLGYAAALVLAVLLAAGLYLGFHGNGGGGSTSKGAAQHGGAPVPPSSAAKPKVGVAPAQPRPPHSAVIPLPVFSAVHGRVVGWARSESDWFVVYVDRTGSQWCGLRGASWRMALVETQKLPPRTIADRRIGGAMCGNELAWVRAGRFSDGRHREVAFMLWADPSLGATTYIYRVGHGHFSLLAKFAGDRVTLGRGTITVGFENRGRSPHGELKDTYRFEGGRYRLVGRR